MRDIVLVAHNLRSTHNVGSLLRTAEGMAVNKVYLTGYTPYPITPNDERLPHISHKLTRDIHKTALGAELTQSWQFEADIHTLIDQLESEGYSCIALEQSSRSVALNELSLPNKIALFLGREVEGVEAEVLNRLKIHTHIPMYGKKESFNVIQATAMALYALRFT